MKRLIYILLSLFLLLSCSNKNKKILVAVSANAQFAVEEVLKSYTLDSATEIEIITGSSGSLTAQIKNGAPYDLFLSADMKYPRYLIGNGFADSELQIYARGILIMWSLNEQSKDIFEPSNWAKFNKIAVANPETAPYGRAAHQALKSIGIYNSIKSKLVFGESIAQTNQFITTNSVTFGFTAKSVLYLNNYYKDTLWREVDDKHYDPIEQGILLLNDDNDCKRLFDYFLSEDAKLVFQKFGYKR